MAKKLNAKSIRQGQTVYCVISEITKSAILYETHKVIVSNNPMPPIGCAFNCGGKVSKMFVMNVAIPSSKRFSNCFITYSRRKAERKAKELNRGLNSERK